MRYDDHGQALTTRTIVSDKYVGGAHGRATTPVVEEGIA